MLDYAIMSRNGIDDEIPYLQTLSPMKCNYTLHKNVFNLLPGLHSLGISLDTGSVKAKKM